MLNDDVAEFPLESSDFGKKLISDLDDNLLAPFTIDVFTSWGILFGDLIGDRTALATLACIFVGEACELPICVVFTDFGLT